MQVSVVGAGVIGLTAALELAAAGHDVTVIAEASGDATTSAVAGALWFPYRAGPPAEVARWAQRTRARLEAIARDAPEAGVDVIEAIERDDDPSPWWIAAIPDAAPIAPGTWRFHAPRVEPARFLPWLEAQLARPIVRASIARLDDVPGDVVINATGLGARTLVGDDTVTGLAGQVAIVAPGDVDLGVALADDRDPAAMFYAIPRRGEVVLGGCARPADTLPAPDDALTARILADAARAGLRPGEVRAIRVGLRPARPTVRLEREGRVVHCYGHGGAGYTLCYGCAEDVSALAP